MVFIPLQVQEHERDEEGKYLRHGDGPPDTVHIQQQGKNEDGGGLEYQRAQEGNGGGDRAVVQCGEEAGDEDVEAGQQEGPGEQAESMGCQLKKPGVVAYEEAGQRRGQQAGGNGQQDTAGGHEQRALAKKALQLTVVLRAEVKADHRCAADRVADKDGHEDELDVHQHTVGGNAVLADEVHELEVIQHTHQGGGDVAHQLGRAVAAGLENGAQA